MIRSNRRTTRSARAVSTSSRPGGLAGGDRELARGKPPCFHANGNGPRNDPIAPVRDSPVPDVNVSRSAGDRHRLRVASGSRRSAIAVVVMVRAQLCRRNGTAERWMWPQTMRSTAG